MFGSGRSDPSQEEEQRKNEVLHQMLDLFLDSVEVEVIQSVLESCNYEYDNCKAALMSMGSIKEPLKHHAGPTIQSPSHRRHPEHQRIQHGNPKSTTPSAMVNSRPQPSPIPIVKPPSRNVNQGDQTLERIHEFIKDGNKILVLMRGCPGSGKSYLANQLLQLSGGEKSNHVFSSDDFFFKNGRYMFNPQELQYAHKSNQDSVLRAVRNGVSPVIVDNTNTQSWEMQVYVIMAVNHGYAVETLEPLTPWKFNHAQLVRRNVHNVPPERIRAMLDRYEHGLKGEDIIKQLKLNYPPSKYPPQPARNILTNRRGQPTGSPAKQLRSPAQFPFPQTPKESSENLQHLYPVFKQMSISQQQPINADVANNGRTDIAAPLELKTESNQPPTCVVEGASGSSCEQTQSPVILWKKSSPQVPFFIPPVIVPESADAVQSSLLDQSPNSPSSNNTRCISLVPAYDSDPDSPTSVDDEVSESTDSQFTGGKILKTDNNIDKDIGHCNENGKLDFVDAEDTWEVLFNKASSSKNDKDCSTDQRQRWVALGIKSDSICDKEEKGTVSNEAQVDPKKSNEWGDNDTASSSWDTMSEEETEDLKLDLSQRKYFQCSKRDNSSNTNYQDFLLSSSSDENELPLGTHLLDARSRDINENVVNYVPPIPKKIVVDVSCMTEDETGRAVTGSLSELHRMFPHVTVGNLEALLETCHGDVNWASNCLLDTDSGVRLDIALSNETPLPEVPAPEVSTPEAHPELNQTVDKAPQRKPELNQQPDGASTSHTAVLNRSHSQTFVHRDSEKSLQLRRSSSLPSVKIQIDHSDHSASVILPSQDQPPSPVETPKELKQNYPLYPELPDDDEISGPTPGVSDESETSSQDDEEMLEFVISSEFSQQLFNRFGGPENKFRKSGLSPVLRIPESIARQIHCYLVLSQEEYYMDDNGEEEEEDELFASAVQDEMDQELYGEMCAQKPLTKQEQEDMELATAIYELDLAAIYNSKDTVATVLARKLLQDTFPTLDPHLLSELMEVQGNSFHRTKEMIQQHYMNSYVVKEKDFPALTDSQTKTITRNRSDISDRVRLRSRNEEELNISRIYNKRAKEQNAKREWSAAAVYSQMARVHRRQHNNMELTVARVFADNMKTYCPSSLDLHCLVVDEALLRLDEFLDGHIRSLADQPNKIKSLYVITGRGKHSSGGVPKIRPAVLQRLHERYIESKLENPGLVKVEITGRSLLSSEC